MSKQEILLEAGTNELEIIEFFIHEEPAAEKDDATSYFGVNVAKVLEVIERPKIEPPTNPPHPSFMGTMPLREKILPMVDLSICMGIDRRESEHEVLLVTHFNKRTAGFLVSGVTRIHRIGWDEVQPPGTFISNVDTNCITGMVHLEDRFVLLADFEKILADLDPDFQMPASTGNTGQAEFKALVSEDSRLMRDLMRQRLEAASFEVTVTDNGVEAWHALLKLKAEAGAAKAPITDYVNIVVTDVEMPAMDGYTLTKNIKSDPVLGVLPVILFSSLVNDRIRHKGESVKADDQITKPEFDQLADRARALLET